jgi:hypothetical protein
MFCHSCGTKVELEVKCSFCEKILDKDDKFCSQCGTNCQVGFDFDDNTLKKLAGISMANQWKSWVNKYGDWVYVIKDGIWRMREDGSHIECINNKYTRVNDKNLNVNHNGLFFIDLEAGLVHLNLDGTVQNVIEYIRDLFYVFDDKIYYDKYDRDSETASLYSCNIDGTANRLLKNISPKPDGSDAPDNIKYLSANNKQIAYYVWTEGDERSGWYLMNIDGTASKKISYKYKVKSHDEEMDDIRELSVIYIDLDNELIYTSGMPSEDKKMGIDTYGGAVWERRLNEPLSDNSYKKMVWEIFPAAYSNDNFDGFYNNNYYFDGNTCYGFVYAHKGINEGKKDHYYNLYALSPNGDSEFLNAGSRGGIEQLVVIGEYAYFYYTFAIRAKLDGSGMVEMRDWFNKK